MNQIYLNYASSSPSLSEQVKRELVSRLEHNQYLNGGRNFEGLDDGAVMLRARKALAKFFGAPKTSHVIFTGGITASINMILGGLLKKGGHVLSTQMEHNAVARPLTLLQRRGVIEVDFLPCAKDGSFDPRLINERIRTNTRLLVMTHASNVLGTILPAAEAFAEAKKHGLFTLLDSAQTAGVLPMTLDENTDALAFTGHKGLGGLQGSGGFVLGKNAAALVDPWIAGGTGSMSESLEQPDLLPDKYESGTANTLGILSLASSVEELLETSVSELREKEKRLTGLFLEGALTIKNLCVHGTQNAERSTAVVSVSSPRHDSAVLSRALYDEYGIITRCGLHCAPLAHQCAGTFPAGTIRFSFGRFTTEEEIYTAVKALEKLSRGTKIAG